jgi:hypothetical protein
MTDSSEKKKLKIIEFFKDKDQEHKEVMKMKYPEKFEKLIEFTSKLNEDNFKVLKKLAIEEGGFLTLENRKKIYDKLLLLGEATVNDEKYDFLFLDHQKSHISKKIINFEILTKSEDEMSKNRMI